MFLNKITTNVSVVAVSAGLMLTVPPMISGADQMVQSAAYAKSEKSRGGSAGNSGNKGGNKGGNSGGKGGNPADKPSKSKGKPPRTRVAATNGDATDALLPREKGRWNASNANQNAFNAHIRNGNFNGTIGALSQYQLALRAASGEPLNVYEQAALDDFVDTVDPREITDEDVLEYLNSDEGEESAVYELVGNETDGFEISCTENCPDDSSQAIADARDDVQSEIDQENSDAQQASYDDFLTDSESRILDESNKELSPEQDQDLLDELADELTVKRAEFPDEDGTDTDDDDTTPDV